MNNKIRLIKIDYVCKIPLHIWKIELNVDTGVEVYNGQEIEDKRRLCCIGTSVNVFVIDGEDVYMRDVSLDYVKLAKVLWNTTRKEIVQF